jgi:hypothetical protein
MKLADVEEDGDAFADFGFLGLKARDGETMTHVVLTSEQM